MLEEREEALRVWLKDQALLELAEVTSWRGSGRVAHLPPPSPPPLVSQHFCSQGRIKGLFTSVFKEGGKVGTCLLRSLHWEVLKKKPPISVWGRSQLIMGEWLKMAKAMWKAEWVFGNTGAGTHSVRSPSTGETHKTTEAPWFIQDWWTSFFCSYILNIEQPKGRIVIYFQSPFQRFGPTS